MWKNFRYSILVIFIIAAIVTPTTDILNMCIFAAPMIALYGISIGVAWLVHPKQRAARRERQAIMTAPKSLTCLVLAAVMALLACDREKQTIQVQPLLRWILQTFH